MAIINFLLVYVFGGAIVGRLLVSIGKRRFDKTLSYLLGYGIAPLFISLLLYYVYWFWPHHQWSFYSIIIYSVWLVILAISIISHRVRIDFKLIRAFVRNFLTAIRTSTVLAKVLLVFIVFTVGFVFIRSQLYPNLWADAIYYFQQGHVYSVDHALDRLGTKVPFSEDGSGYVMDPSIRPALPILYSFFYTSSNSQNIFIFSGSFLYFYYFILTLGIFSYILKKFQFNYERIVIGLTLLLSSYYLINFLIYGFKEMIFIFFLLAALIVSYIATEKITQFIPLGPALIGILVGLSVYIHFSGVIIGGIIVIIYFVKLCSNKTRFRQVLFNMILLSIFLVLCTGQELQYDLGFISKLDLPLQSSSSIGATEASEYSIYKISTADQLAESDPSQAETVTQDSVEPQSSQAETVTQDSVEPQSSQAETTSEISAESDPLQKLANEDLKLQILLKGKLQGLTQVQFYGFIFLLFIVVLIARLVQQRKLTYFEKSILGYFCLFFFIVMDPFFLNTHPQAYVLSISPKYTIVLIPLAALFITMNYDLLLQQFAKIPLKYFLLLIGFSLLLFPAIRRLAVLNTLNIFDTIIPLYNSLAYYFDKLDKLYLDVGIFFLITTIVIGYLVVIKIRQDKKTEFVNLLFISSFFTLPFLFLLNSNYNIIGTIRNIFESKEIKLEMIETNEDAAFFLKAINYLNNKTEHNTKILLLYSRYSIYYIENYHRFVFNVSTDQVVDVQNANYILLRTSDLELYEFNAAVELEQTFGSTTILKILR